MTDHTQYDFFRTLADSLSRERWETYRATPVEDDAAVAGRYAWNLALCESLYPALHAVEVALRNRLVVAIGSAFTIKRYVEVDCWLDATPAILLPNERQSVHGAKHRLRQALRKKFATKAEMKAHMTAGGLVAELPFGFWTYLLGSGYAASPIRTGRFWPQLLSAVFPALPRGAQRADVERRLNAIRQLRNRVFHHEPIWRRADLSNEYRRIIECVRWLSPELARSVAAMDRFQYVRAPSVHRLLRRRATQLAS